MELEINALQIVGKDHTEFNGAIGVLIPSTRPRLALVGNFLQIHREDVTNPNQCNFEAFIGDALNALARLTAVEELLAVTSTFFLDPHEETGFPVFTLLKLKGAAVDEEKINKFRAAVVFVTSEITGHQSMFYGLSTQQLTEEEVSLLSAECHRFSIKNSGKKITNGFTVYTDFEDEFGLPVSGELPRVSDGEAVTEVLSGLAWPNGYCETSNVVHLCLDGENDTTALNVTFQCRHPDAYDIVAQAKLCRSKVRYQGYRTKGATGKNDRLNLDSIELVSMGPDDNEPFQLKP